MNNELDEVRDLLNDYLVYEYRKSKPSKNDHINDVIHRTYDQLENLLSKEIGIYIINLNYTNTASLYLEKRENRDLVYLHGYLNGIESYKPLFGYGDEESDSYKNLERTGDNDLLKNIKSIKYQENENLAKVYDWLDKDIFEVVIMGLSCGFSDRTLLKEIFNHKNCEKIFPNYYGNDSFNRVANISRCFTDKEKFRRRVANKNECKKFY